MASSVSELAFNIAYERTTSLLKSAVKGKDYPAIPQSKMLRSAHKAFTELANALREHGEQHVPTGLRLTVFFESKSAMVTPLYKAMPTEDELELVAKMLGMANGVFQQIFRDLMSLPGAPSEGAST